MAGFKFVGRDDQIKAFRRMLAGPEGRMLIVGGPEGSGKSLLLSRLRAEAEAQGRHFVQLNRLAHLPDADVRLYSILSSMAFAHGESRGGPGAKALLVPNGQEFFERVMTGSRRTPREKLLGVFSVASSHLPPEARLVLLLDLGRLEGEEAFPLEFLARRLPEKIKVIVAVPRVPEWAGAIDQVVAIEALPPLSDGEVAALLKAHCPALAEERGLAGAVVERYGGLALGCDLAVKLMAGGTRLADLPAEPAGLCGALLESLSLEQRRLVECVALIPSGVDIGLLRSVSGFSDGELRAMLGSEGVRNSVLILRGVGGPEAHLFHEMLADRIVASGEPAAEFHKQVASYFLARAEQRVWDIEAVAAHDHHLRQSRDKRQFIADFPKTYKTKHTLGLFGHLAAEYETLLAACDELGEESINRPVCLANLGRVYQRLGQHEEALRCHREALGLYEQAADVAGTAGQLAETASVLSDLGRLEEALGQLQRAIELDEQSGNQAALAADLNNLGILLQGLGRLDEAKMRHERALKLHRELGNDVGAANQLANLAAISQKQDDLEAARKFYQEAWRLDNRTGSTVAEIADLCNLGLVFEQLGEMEKALTCLQQAIELDRSIADREAEAAHLRTLAVLHRKTGACDEAIALLRKAREVAQSIGEPGEEVAALLELAETHLQAGEEPLAVEILERAAAMAANIGDDEAEARAREALAALRAAPAQGESPASPGVGGAPDQAGQWDDLHLVDEGGPPQPTSRGAGEAPDRDELIARLTRERDEALERAAELEAELEEYKRIVESLRAIVGQAMRNT